MYRDLRPELEQACAEVESGLPKGYGLSIMYSSQIINSYASGVWAYCERVIAPLGKLDLEAWNAYWESEAKAHGIVYHPIMYDRGRVRHGSSACCDSADRMFHKELVSGPTNGLAPEQIKAAAESLADLTKDYAKAVEIYEQKRDEKIKTRIDEFGNWFK